MKAVLDVVEGTRKDIVEEKGSGDKPKPPEDKKPDDKPAETGSVSGKVTYKGQPLTAGVVILTGADGKTHSADLAADGTYSFKDVKVGEYKVAVDTDNPKNPAKAVKVPAKYQDSKTSGITVDVRKGEATHDIDLE